MGGKNASLGEMIAGLRSEGIRVPNGFATTAAAYREFLGANDLEGKIRRELDRFGARKAGAERSGRGIRRLFASARFPDEVDEHIRQAYRTLCRRSGANGDLDVAVRSSATAEDLPDASFAGQQETFLNVRGEEALLKACRRCYASLFTDRAIAYRSEKGFDDMQVALSVGVQKMVRSDKAGSGVMFTLDTETGFRDVVVINAAWGLGENVVQGAVTPDEFLVFKPFLGREELVPIIGKSLGEKQKTMVYAKGRRHPTKNLSTPKSKRRAFVLDDAEVLTLAEWALAIEAHYGMPMDIEWAKDGDSGELYIVQVRPETVQSRKTSGQLTTFTLQQKGELLLTGLSIGGPVAAGRVCRIKRAEQIDRFEDGSLLVTEMTDPDWVPIMKRARGIITDHGGRTCHAAIVSRELGIPAIVGTGPGHGAAR